MSEQPKYGLPPKEEFSRDSVAKRMIGSIVKIKTCDGLSGGILVEYVPGDYAILKPYIDIVADKISIEDEESLIELPGIVSRTSCKTLEEFVKKHVKPVLDEYNKKSEKKGK